jgi:hypothetical protein
MPNSRTGGNIPGKSAGFAGLLAADSTTGLSLALSRRLSLFAAPASGLVTRRELA